MPEIPMHFLFFPGMVFHELSHYFACALFGLKVSKIKLFGSKEAFVEHEKPNALQAIAITLAPFVFGNLFALYFFVFASQFAGSLDVSAVLLYWLAFSFAIFSFPSKQDAVNAFSSFTDFYKNRVFKKSALESKILWLFLFPFLFVPLVLLLGTMAAFDYSILLRLGWAMLVFVFSADQSVFFGALSSLASAFLQAVSAAF